MSEQMDLVKRLMKLPIAIGESLDQFGGFLRCETCYSEMELNTGDAGFFTMHGWPKCCNQTMRWWTQRQIDAGEVPR